MKTRIILRSNLNPIRLAMILLMLCLMPLGPSTYSRSVSAAPTSNMILYFPNITRDYLIGVNGALSGVVNDSTTGAALESATICVDGALCVTTHADGRFSYVDLPPGNHTLSVTLTSYSDFSQMVTVNTGIAHFVPVSLSKTNLAQGFLRIVLTWQVEGDLDANLFMWNYTRQRVYWHDRGNCDNLAVDLACLENDNTHFGPETIIIRPGVTGTHSFAVARNGTLEVTQYGAVVNIYDSSGLAQTFYSPPYSPPSGFGSWWHVFNLVWDPAGDKYNLVTVNHLLYAAPTGP